MMLTFTLLLVLLAGLSATADAARPTIPRYVLDYAPLVYLDQKETFFPSDIGSHLRNTFPAFANLTKINAGPAPLTLSNLDTLNRFGNATYLASKEGIAAQPKPKWFNGVKPVDDRSLRGAVASVVITVPKDRDTLDAFYFYFYAYNKGLAPLSIPSDHEFGNHVGDWEHNMIRFRHSKAEPNAIWYSQHSSGQAYTFSTVYKATATGNKRPLVYAARGTHANYPTTGRHSTLVPGVAPPGIVVADVTSDGTLWDPLLNAYFFQYNVRDKSYESIRNPITGEGGRDPAFLRFIGRWGDPQLSDTTPGQRDVFGVRKYVAGPEGPGARRLARKQVCDLDERQRCEVKRTLIGA